MGLWVQGLDGFDGFPSQPQVLFGIMKANEGGMLGA